MKQHIESSLREASTALDALLRNPAALATIEDAAALLIRTFEQRGKVYSCGNGGSMCDAMHFAEELTGRDRRAAQARTSCALPRPPSRWE